MKRCCRCKKTKEITLFNKNKSTKDGHAHECRECGLEIGRVSYLKNREKILKESKKKYHENIELSRKIKRDYASKNRESELSRAKKWYESNKERKQIYDKEYAKKNREKRRLASKKNRRLHPKRKQADCALRRCQKMEATPPWVDCLELRKIYENCPNGYHVDHIVPLNNKTVCGLHVPWNLQYLTREDNLKKSNHYSWGEK